MREAVVLIHGVWMVGAELLWLRRRIQRHGFICRQFHYHSLLRAPRANAIKLDEFLKRIDADVIHLVAHSLGGIVVLHLFEYDPLQKPGRVVMMGTPLHGSEMAARMYRWVIARPLLGRSVTSGLLGGAPSWKGARELGMIAGNRGKSMVELIFGAVERPSDGTVAVRETRSAQLGAHLCVPYSHMGMLRAEPVCEAVCRFLRSGAFEPE